MQFPENGGIFYGFKEKRKGIFCNHYLHDPYFKYFYLCFLITRESVITSFETNREHFGIIKVYMLTQDNSYFIDKDNYDSEIKDVKVKKSMKYVLEDLGYKYIQNNLMKSELEMVSTSFLRGGNNNDEFGIVYGGTEGLNFGQESEYLGDGWYFYWIGYYLKY